MKLSGEEILPDLEIAGVGGLPETVTPLERTISVSRSVRELPSMELHSYTIRTSHAAARLATDSGESGRSAARR